MTKTYVPLHIHTSYSLAEGAVRPKDLAKNCVKNKIPAAAMTDTNNLAGAYEFSKTLMAEGIQPIIGAQIQLLHPGQTEEETSKIVLLAQNETGYKNLINLISSAWMNGEINESPKLPIQKLKDKTEGIILLTGGLEGPIHKAFLKNDPERAYTRIKSLKALFKDRVYLQITRTNTPGEKEIESLLIELSNKTKTPIVASNEIYFLEEDKHEAHDALLCIADGTHISTQDRRYVSTNSYLKTPEEMIELFSDIPEAIENTIKIAQRCSYVFEPKDPMLPPFPGLEGKTEAEEIRIQSIDGLKFRLKQSNIKEDSEEAKPYFDRLEYELGIIIQMGFPGYFLIVSDFIKWAKANDIAVGPGRGSGAGSVVAWSLQITNLDPLRYGLLFERFLNPDRVSMPDFDVDFCQERRDEVIEYVKKRYGEERVAQIGTYGKLKARAVVRDVGRVMQIPYPVVDRFVRMIPNNPTQPVTLQEAMHLEPLCDELEKADSSIRNLFDIALKLEGLFRHSSTHAAGVVIADRPVWEVVPIMRDDEGAVVTQFDMKSVELAGLVKFDFLGLKTLDVIDNAVKMIEEKENITIDLDLLGVEDEPTYDMLAKADSFGVFQLESPGMRVAMRQIAPSTIDDLIALVSLYRPGPMENIPTYARVKHNEEVAHYLDPQMEPVLNETFGIIIYQEQVMELARKLAGYSLGQADILRRAMGKKIQEEMDKQKDIFVEGAHKRGIEESVAIEIFELIARFANYGFNKSHAAAYALIAFHTAWLKAHYPHEFFAASMNMDMDKVEKIAEFYQECRRVDLSILPPDINASEAKFSVVKHGQQKSIRYALAAIRGVGVTAMKDLIEERNKNGRFTSLSDLVQRTVKFMNRRSYEGLIKAGALDSLHGNRGALLEALNPCLKEAQSETKRKETGQVSFFDNFLTPPETTKIPDIPEMPYLERLSNEFNALGVHISGHPLNAAQRRLKTIRAHQLVDIFNPVNHINGDVKFGALLIKLQVKMSKKQEPMAILMLSDPTFQVETLLFSDMFHQYRSKLEEGSAYVITAGVSDKDGERRLYIRDIEPLPLDPGMDGK